MRDTEHFPHLGASISLATVARPNRGLPLRRLGCDPELEKLLLVGRFAGSAEIWASLHLVSRKVFASQIFRFRLKLLRPGCRKPQARAASLVSIGRCSTHMLTKKSLMPW